MEGIILEIKRERTYILEFQNVIHQAVTSAQRELFPFPKLPNSTESNTSC